MSCPSDLRKKYPQQKIRYLIHSQTEVTSRFPNHWQAAAPPLTFGVQNDGSMLADKEPASQTFSPQVLSTLAQKYYTRKKKWKGRIFKFGGNKYSHVLVNYPKTIQRRKKLHGPLTPFSSENQLEDDIQTKEQCPVSPTNMTSSDMPISQEVSSPDIFPSQNGSDSTDDSDSDSLVISSGEDDDGDSSNHELSDESDLFLTQLSKSFLSPDRNESSYDDTLSQFGGVDVYSQEPTPRPRILGKRKTRGNLEEESAPKRHKGLH